MAQVAVDVQRDRNVLYREARGGEIENVYIIKVFNKSSEPRIYDLAVQGHPELSLSLPADRLSVGPNSTLQLPVTVQLDPAFMEGTNMAIEFKVTVEGDPDISATAKSRFMGPTLR